MPPNACVARSLRLAHQPPAANSREQHSEVREQDGGSSSRQTASLQELQVTDSVTCSWSLRKCNKALLHAGEVKRVNLEGSSALSLGLFLCTVYGVDSCFRHLALCTRTGYGTSTFAVCPLQYVSPAGHIVKGTRSPYAYTGQDF